MLTVVLCVIRSLLSAGFIGSSAVSSGYEHVFVGPDERGSVRVVREGLLLSFERHCVGGAAVSGGLLLS